jgi:hypothetical protein
MLYSKFSRQFIVIVRRDVLTQIIVTTDCARSGLD